MQIPSNYTEEEVLEIFEKIAGRLAYKFRFGYYSVEDMKQEAMLEAWKGLEKYRPDKGPLENFLWTHVRNRLFNKKRNELARPDKPCTDCPLGCYIRERDECTEYSDLMECEFYNNWVTLNSSKRNIMEPIGISEVNDENESGIRQGTSVLDDLANREIIELIDDQLEVDLRKEWLLLQAGERIPKQRRILLMTRIDEIINGEEARKTEHGRV